MRGRIVDGARLIAGVAIMWTAAMLLRAIGWPTSKVEPDEDGP